MNRIRLVAVAGLSTIAACSASSQGGPSSSTSADAGLMAPDSGGLPSGTADGGSPSTGTGDAGILTCNWVFAPNCWKAVLEPAESCLPPFDPNNKIPGLLNPDLTHCTYPSGQTVNFPGGLKPGVPIAFSITSDAGAPCLSTTQSANGFTVTTDAGTVSVSVDPPGPITLVLTTRRSNTRRDSFASALALRASLSARRAAALASARRSRSHRRSLRGRARSSLRELPRGSPRSQQTPPPRSAPSPRCCSSPR
jgi:hypothetical protein